MDEVLHIVRNSIGNEKDAILSVQIGEKSEVAEVRRDGATELIRVEVANRATVGEHTTIDNEINSKVRWSIIRDQMVEENDAIMNIQIRQVSEFAELRGNGASELIRVQVP